MNASVNKQFDAESAVALGRSLIRTARDAALGTLDVNGGPHVSHVAAASLCDGSPLVAVSGLAAHTRHLDADPRAALLFVAPEGESGDTNTRARISLSGKMMPVADRALARGRILRRHPDAFYVDFADFRLMRFEIAAAHLVAGFGRIVDIQPDRLVAAADDAAAIGAIDEGACEHMNADHADALALMASGLAGGPAGEWRAIGVDPEGIDLALGERVVRVDFDAPVADGGALRVALKRLADRARGATAA